MTQEEQLAALERISKLRETGTLTEEEFQKAKEKLLDTSPKPIFYRRLWFVVLLTVLILTFPIALLILLTGDVYRGTTEAGFVAIGRGPRFAYAGALAVWLAAASIYTAVNEPTASGGNTDSGDSQNASATELDTCESQDAADMVKSAIEDSATSAIVKQKVLDFGSAKETGFDKSQNIRYCQATAYLNTGNTDIAYKLYFGPSGGEMVEEQDDPNAYSNELAALSADANDTRR